MAGDPSGGKPSRLELEWGAGDTLTKLKGDDERVVLVVRNVDVDRVCQLQAEVFYRGKKEEEVALTRLLLGHDRVPVVSGSYKAPGRLMQGIQAFLSRAASQNDRNVYIVGADDDVFEALWDDAEVEPAPTPSPAARPMALDELLNETPPPAQLQETLALLEQRFTGTTKEHRLVRQMVLRAADLDVTVLLVGDTGTGKSLVARLIHENSVRRGQPFVEINCAAISPELFESELFGHMKGAFTGAVSDKPGLWEIASRGTLFLDEVGDLRLDHQGKILHALHARIIRRVGGTKDIPVNARVIAATNRHLLSMIRSGQFRSDLYFRLRQLPIPTPAVGADPGNFSHVVQRAWQRVTGDPGRQLPEGLVAELRSRRWPGNIREIKSVLVNLQALFGMDNLRVEHLRELLRFYEQALAPGSDAGQDLTRHRFECLGHLRRAEEVVHACKVALRPIDEESRMDAASRESLRMSLGCLRDDLDNLCRQPALFHGKAAYDAADQLVQKLGYFLRLVGKDDRETQRHWRMELTPEIERTLAVVFQEVQNVMDRMP